MATNGALQVHCRLGYSAASRGPSNTAEQAMSGFPFGVRSTIAIICTLVIGRHSHACAELATYMAAVHRARAPRSLQARGGLGERSAVSQVQSEWLPSGREWHRPSRGLCSTVPLCRPRLGETLWAGLY